jgi:hypothetical protein
MVCAKLPLSCSLRTSSRRASEPPPQAIADATTAAISQHRQGRKIESECPIDTFPAFLRKCFGFHMLGITGVVYHGTPDTGERQQE